MAEFSGKVIDAYFFDDEYTTIEVIYKHENGEMVSYILEADPSHPDMQDLVDEGWDTEKLAAATVEYKIQQSTAFNEAISKTVDIVLQESKSELDRLRKEKEIAQKEKENIDKQKVYSQRDVDNEMFDVLLKNNEEKDVLFKFKLWALELENMKKAKKEVKTKIRKAKSIFECIEIINNVDKPVS